MRYLAKNIYRERCIATNSNNHKFKAKYVYWMHGLRNTQESSMNWFFFIYTQSYYLFCVNVNVINNRILDHLFQIFYNYFYRHEIQNYHKMRILKILISLALGYAITSHIALRFTKRYISLTQTYILT